MAGNSPIVRDYMELSDRAGLLLKGAGTNYDDVLGNLNGKKIATGVGTIGTNWDIGFIQMEKSGDITKANNRLVWPNQYIHKFKVSTQAFLHFHVHYLLKVDDTNEYNFKCQYAVAKNGHGLSPGDIDWVTFDIKNAPAYNKFDFSNANGKTHILQISEALTPFYEDLNVSDIIITRVTRSDNVGEDILDVGYLDFHAEVNGLGSADEYIKY